MKTTNYEVSKKLKEAGFAYEYDCGYTPKGKLIDIEEQMGAYHIRTPSFCLETILDALPSRITNENIFIPRIDYYLRLSKEEIWYENECNCDSNESCPVNQRFEVSRIKDESLADTAGRLWLLLKEKGLV